MSEKIIDVTPKEWVYESENIVPCTDQTVSFSQGQFFFTFALRDIRASGVKIIVKSRVLMSPTDAKNFSRVLSQIMDDYERKFGKIVLTLGKE